MKKFAVIQILTSFSEEEIKDFDKVVRSPYFGGSNYIIKFWNEIKKAYPDFDEKKIARERIFKKLYPGKKYDDAVIRKMSSNLLKMAEKYIGIKRADRNDYRIIDFYTMLELRERKLFNLYENKYKDLNKYYETSSVYDYIKLIDRHMMQIQQMNYVTDISESHRNFEERMLYYEYLIIYTLTTLMQETTRIWVDKTVYGNEKENNVASEMLKHFNIDEYLDSVKLRSTEYMPLVKLNRLLMKMFSDNAARINYDECKDYLFTEAPKMPKKASRMYFIFLMNYCLNKIRYSDREYSFELSAIADKMRELDIIIDSTSKHLTPGMYNVIMDCYINSHRLDEAESFLNEYAKYILPEYRKDAVNYSKTNLLFAKGEYEEALYHINTNEPQMEYDRLNNRLTKLMILFELDRWEEFYLLIDSTRQFIRGNTGLAERFENDALKFLSIFKKLHEVKEGKEVDIDELKYEIQSTEQLINKTWLNEKLKSLK